MKIPPKSVFIAALFVLNALTVIYHVWERNRLLALIDLQAEHAQRSKSGNLGPNASSTQPLVSQSEGHTVRTSSHVRADERGLQDENGEEGNVSTADEFDQVRNEAEKNWKMGAYSTAVEQMLWCYRNGHIKDASASNRIRLRLLQWSDENQLAYGALVSLREEAKAKYPTGSIDRKHLEQLLLLCRDTGDDDFNLGVFNSLNDSNPLKKIAAAFVFEPLVQRGDYKSALETQPYGAMLLVLDDVARRLKAADTSNSQAAIIASFGSSVEALAGSGRNEEAKVVIRKLLEIDPTGSSRTMIEERLRKVGRLDILYSL